jgi:hypothetical protein
VVAYRLAFAQTLPDQTPFLDNPRVVGQQPVDAHPPDLAGGPAEDPFRGTIPRRDAVSDVERDDPLGRVTDDARQEVPRLFQLFVASLQLELEATPVAHGQPSDQRSHGQRDDDRTRSLKDLGCRRTQAG